MCSLLTRGSLFFCTVNVNVAAVVATKARGGGAVKWLTRVPDYEPTSCSEGGWPPHRVSTIVRQKCGLDATGGILQCRNKQAVCFLPRILSVTENRTIGSVCTVPMWFVPVVCDRTCRRGRCSLYHLGRGTGFISSLTRK